MNHACRDKKLYFDRNKRCDHCNKFLMVVNSGKNKGKFAGVEEVEGRYVHEKCVGFG